MKKSLIALAVMAAAGAASAQSSVTLFGIVDATIAYGRANGTGSDSRTQLTSGGYNSSRLGFRGVEDLGGGMNASFWLEGQIFADDGTAGQRIPVQNTAVVQPTADGAGLVFNRRATVSLGGTWGELRLGRDFTPTFYNITVFDPFGTNGVGTTLTTVGPGSGLGAVRPAGTPSGAGTFVPVGTRNVLVRASNQITYFLPPNLGGVYGQIGYWHGDEPSNATVAATPGTRQSDGNGAGLRVGYGAGPFTAAASWARTKYAAGDFTEWNLGGQWDFGLARLMAQYSRDERDTGLTTAEVDGRGFLVGALVPVGAGEIRASYSQYKIDFGAGADPRARQVALGYVHNLSKRTAVYTTVAHVRNRDGAAVTLNGATMGTTGRNSTGLDLGVRHAF